jgi:hypothetical protein
MLSCTLGCCMLASILVHACDSIAVLSRRVWRAGCVPVYVLSVSNPAQTMPPCPTRSHPFLFFPPFIPYAIWLCSGMKSSAARPCAMCTQLTLHALMHPQVWLRWSLNC